MCMISILDMITQLLGKTEMASYLFMQVFIILPSNNNSNNETILFSEFTLIKPLSNPPYYRSHYVQ